MPFIPNIIKRVDEFFKIAERYSLVSLGASDPELYAELAKAAEESVNPELSYNLTVLAAMYRKALEINGGFHTVYMALSGIIEDIDPDEEESEPVENLLNQIGSSIKTRAQRPDSPGDIRELQAAATAARAEDSPFSYDEPEEDETSIYEQSLLGGGGAQKAFEDEGGISQFDLTGGVSTEAAQGGTGRGYSVGKVHTLKDWATIYAAEKEKYDRDKQMPDEMLSPAARKARKDTKVTDQLDNLTDVLAQLIALVKEASDLQYKIAIETEVDHTADNERLAEIGKDLNRLERERRLAKRNLNKFYKTSELDVLKEKANDPSLTQQDKRILEEKIKLQELRTSGKYGYGKEAKERLRLINALLADPNLSPVQFQKMQDSIDQAKPFTDKQTKTEYDRRQTVERAKAHGKIGIVPERQKGRIGGGREGEKHNQYNLQTASLVGLVDKLGEKINTAAHVARLNVTQEKNKAHNALKPYVEAISKTIQNAGKIKAKLKVETDPKQREKLQILWSKAHQDRYDAIKQLKLQMDAWAARAPAIKALEKNVRWVPHFIKYKNELVEIASWQTDTGWILDDEKKNKIIKTINNINVLLDRYERFYGSKVKPGTTPLDMSFDKAVEFFKEVMKVITPEMQQLSKIAQLNEKQEYDRTQSIERAIEHGKVGPVSKRKQQRGGSLPGEKRNTFNYELATFNGLVEKLSDQINTAINSARQKVTQEKDKTHNALKPYVEELSAAIRKGDSKKKYEAIKNLKRAIDSWPDRIEGLRILEKSTRLLPYFNKLKTDLFQISEWVDQAGRLRITPARMSFILNTIQYAARLQNIYNTYYPQFGKLRLAFNPPLEMLELVINRLNTMIASSAQKLQESGVSL